MKQFVRAIFRIRPFEKVLALILGRFPGSFLRHAVSSNTFYSTKSIRICKRYGVNYRLDISDYQNWLLYFHSHIDSSFGVINYLKTEKVIFDIGGNIGQTALMMAKHAAEGATIYSFEPYPATNAKFQKNLQLNRSLSNKIRLLQVALGAASGKLTMYEDCLTNSGANRMVPEHENVSSATTEVEVSTVDLFAAKNHVAKIDFIKIDVEGFEMEVLKGAYSTLEKDKPTLFIEVDDKNLNRQCASAVELCEYLENLGYSIFEEGHISAFDFYKIDKPVNIYCSSKSVSR